MTSQRKMAFSSGLQPISSRRIIVKWIIPLAISLASVTLRAGSIFDDDWSPPPRTEPEHGGPVTPPTPRPAPPAVPTPEVTPVPVTGAAPGVPSLPAVPVGRLAIPGKADLAKSRKLMKEVFAAELADRTIPGRRAFCQKLLPDVGKYGESPADKFVILGGAITAAEEGGDLRACLTAADQLAVDFQIDGQSVKADAALKMPAKAYAANAADNVTAGLDLLDQLASSEDFSTAARLGSVLQPVAANDEALNRLVQQRKRYIDAMRVAKDKIAAQLAKLKDSPNDPAANLAVGSYYCFIAEQWDRGLLMLAKGSDAVLKNLAKSELAKPSSADAIVRLGDGWWDMASRLPAASHDHICRHAASLYAAAHDGISGLQRALLEKRIAEAAAMEGHTESTIAASSAKSFTNTFGMKFIRIEPGEFLMGSPDNEQGRSPNEIQHRVKITRPFMLAATTVTQQQWQALMGNNPSRFKAPDLSVETVSWNDAVAFCRKLSEKEGRHYRLPTEAEWEYACRAGTTDAYAIGDQGSLADYAWFKENSGGTIHPVASKKPNAWGLFDMHGNVFQWCSDYYAEYPPGDATEPTGPQAGDKGSPRVLRGGSWDHDARYCRAAYRAGNAPASRFYHVGVGFRVCLDL